MFEKILARIAMKHYKRKEKKEGRKYQRHFKADDGRVFDLYSNEYIGEEKAEAIIEYLQKNISAIDSGNFDEVHSVVIGIMGYFYDFGAMVNLKVKVPEKLYEIVIIE